MLRIVDVILALISEVSPLVERIAPNDSDLAKQIRCALSNVALNVAEGSAQRGARLTNHYAIALGSARESYVALRTAAAWGYVGPMEVRTRERFDHVIGTLVKLTR